MSDINLVKPHALPMPKAKAMVQQAADGLTAEYGVTSEWHGNTLHFHRSGVAGRIHVTDSTFVLDVALGPLLKPLRGKLVGQIERDFDRLLAQQESKARTRRLSRKTARAAR